MLRSVLCVLLALAPLRASAEVYVCQETAVGGLKWENGAWQTTTYKGDTFTLSRLGSDDPALRFCGVLAPEVSITGVVTHRNYGACYKFALMGGQHEMIGCTTFETDGKITRVRCNFPQQQLELIPNGEMVRTEHTGAPSFGELPSQRGSLYVAAGHCNRVD